MGSVFSKNTCPKERVKPWFFVTLNIFMSHIFPEKFKLTPPQTTLLSKIPALLGLIKVK